MAELTYARLDELEALLEKATQGEWELRLWAKGGNAFAYPGGYCYHSDKGMSDEDAAALLALHNAAPALLACARREKRLRWLLANLYAMVQGEVPSLLEDHHLAAEIDEALKED